MLKIEAAPVYEPTSRKHRAIDARERLKRKYGILLIGTFALAAYTMLLCCITGTIVHHNTIYDMEQEIAAEYEARLEAYKAEQAYQLQASHWLSGEASLEAQINKEADLLAKGMQIWKNDRAKGTFIWNALMRMESSLYPGNLEEILSAPKQYDWWSEKNPITAADRELAISILKDYHAGIWPSDLTIKHIYLEMRDGGNDCVLHTAYDHSGNDNQWRWPG